MITCDFCHWTNVELLNLGGPGKTKWICHACVKREIDSKTDLLDQLTKAQAKIAAYDKTWNDMNSTICTLEHQIQGSQEKLKIAVELLKQVQFHYAEQLPDWSKRREDFLSFFSDAPKTQGG